MAYWWLWVLDTVLVSAGLLFFLALQYGTYEFFGKACAMAFLPLIPVLVLVGPALVVTLALGLLGAFKSPGHRLAYLCLGKAPASATQVRITGYSTFLREEWLAVFKVGQNDFQTLVANAKLVPADGIEFQNLLKPSALKTTRLFQSLAPLNNAIGYKRVFKESEEHERGTVFALFDPPTSTAIVVREYHD